MIRSWLRNRHWRKSQAPREGWLRLYDVYGDIVAVRPVTLVPTTEGKFANPHEIEIHNMPPVQIAAITLVDADGNELPT